MPEVSFAQVKDGGHDPSIASHVLGFLEKLRKDDTLLGLHIEPIHGSVDPKVRTGRVTQFYRAVLFKLSVNGVPHYVYTGVWPHDEAIKIARTSTLKQNPVTSLVDLVMASESEAKTQPMAPKPDHWPASAPHQPKSILASAQPHLTPDYVTEVLGLDEQLVKTAWAMLTDDAFIQLAEQVGGWRQEALLELAAGTQISQIQQTYVLNQIEEVLPNTIESGDEDTAIVEALRRPESHSQFVWLEDDDELRRVVEGGSLANWRIFLHPEQRKYVEGTWAGPYRLSGGAGTGKTVVLIHRTRELALRNPDARILLTTFNRTLADGMQRSLLALDPDIRLAKAPGEPGVYVAGVDQVASQILANAAPEFRAAAVHAVLGVDNSAKGRVQSEDVTWGEAVAAVGASLPLRLRSPSFLAAEYEAIVLPHRITNVDCYLKARRPGRGVALDRAQRTSLWQVIEVFREICAATGVVTFGEACAIAAVATQHDRRFDHALIDEGQDLTAPHWQVLRATTIAGADDLFIAEDGQQRIYGQRIVLGRYGVKIVGRSRRLTLNYRTTQQVLGFATSVLAGESYLDPEGNPVDNTGYRSVRSGPAPRLVPTGSLDELSDQAAAVLTAWMAAGVAGEGVAVIVRTHKLALEITSRLAELDVSVQPITSKVKSDLPRVVTMHRAKGLEFTHVLIIGCDDNTLSPSYVSDGGSDSDSADPRERSLFYVASTRARDELVMLWSGTPSRFLPSTS